MQIPGQAIGRSSGEIARFCPSLLVARCKARPQRPANSRPRCAPRRRGGSPPARRRRWCVRLRRTRAHERRASRSAGPGDGVGAEECPSPYAEAGGRWRGAPPPLPWRPGPRRWQGRTSEGTPGANAGSPPSLSRARRSRLDTGAGRPDSPGAGRSPGSASAPAVPPRREAYLPPCLLLSKPSLLHQRHQGIANHDPQPSSLHGHLLSEARTGPSGHPATRGRRPVWDILAAT
jgi:hypothetical protein